MSPRLFAGVFCFCGFLIAIGSASRFEALGERGAKLTVILLVGAVVNAAFACYFFITAE